MLLIEVSTAQPDLCQGQLGQGQLAIGGLFYGSHVLT
jgi:hypothetical protein